MALVKQSVHGQIATLTLNRPQKHNALNSRLIAELTTRLRQYADDDDLRVIILTGAGPSFCAGADLQQLEQLQGRSPMENRRDSSRLAELFTTIYHCEKPVIAQVNGNALGGGAGLVASCDWTFASAEAVIGFPEVRLGFVPAIVMPFLVRRIGEADARDLLLRGRRLRASESVRVGLVHEVCPPDELKEAVHELADELVRETSASAVALTKRLLGRTSGAPLEEALDAAVLTNAFARGTEDCRAGVSAFLSGERPPWKRRFSE